MKQTIATKGPYDERAAAEFLGVTVFTMRDWRFRKVGPSYVKYLNKAIRYEHAALERFLEQSRVATAA